jgi:hypothetical protein
MNIKFTFIVLSAILLCLIFITGRMNNANDFFFLIYITMFFPIFSIFYSVSKLSSRIALFSLLNCAFYLTFHIIAYLNNAVDALEFHVIVLIGYGFYLLLPSIGIFGVSYLFYEYLRRKTMASSK